MSATRITRSRRPAPTGAGRLVSHALLAIVSLIVAVFAHGGACATLEMAEQASRLTHLTETSQEHVNAGQHGEHCWHHQLPDGHRHGTEQDDSAIGPAAPPTPGTLPASVAVPPPAAAGTTAPVTAERHPAPHREELCVLRI